jgi:hypothetical protein
LSYYLGIYFAEEAVTSVGYVVPNYSKSHELKMLLCRVCLGSVTRVIIFELGDKRNISKRNTSKRNTSKRNTSKRNTSKRNTSKRNASKRNTSNHNTSQRNTSKSNTSKHIIILVSVIIKSSI